MNSPIGAAKKLFFILAALALTIPATGQGWQPWAMKPDTASAVEYVALTCGNVTRSALTTEGSLPCSDSNDGKSWGTAKATIPNAILALPSCSDNVNTFTHCGLVEVGAGTFSVSAQTTINSELVSISGRGTGSTVISYTGSTGCAFAYTNSISGANASLNMGGLFRLTIDGTNAGAGTCGLETYDLLGFIAEDVMIVHFNKAGSIGWWDNAITQFNERFDIRRMAIGDCTTAWSVTPQTTSSGYPTTDFGYGNFNLFINILTGQTAVSFPNGSLEHSILHLIVNGDGGLNETGISLAGSAEWFQNIYEIHLESISTSINLNGASTKIVGLGSIDLGGPAVTGTGTYVVLNPDTSGNITYKGTFILSPPLDIGTSGANTSGGINIGSTLVNGFTTLSTNSGASAEGVTGSALMLSSVGGTNFLAVDGAGNLGVLGSANSKNINLFGSTSGSTLFQPTAVASGTITLPAATGTVGLVISGSVAGSITALAANSCGDAVTATVTGATTSMVATASPQAAISAGLVLSTPFVSAANTVTVGYCNVTTASITPAAATFNIRVIQ